MMLGQQLITNQQREQLSNKLLADVMAIIDAAAPGLAGKARAAVAVIVAREQCSNVMVQRAARELQVNRPDRPLTNAEQLLIAAFGQACPV